MNKDVVFLDGSYNCTLASLNKSEAINKYKNKSFGFQFIISMYTVPF